MHKIVFCIGHGGVGGAGPPWVPPSQGRQQEKKINFDGNTIKSG